MTSTLGCWGSPLRIAHRSRRGVTDTPNESVRGTDGSLDFSAPSLKLRNPLIFFCDGSKHIKGYQKYTSIPVWTTYCTHLYTSVHIVRPAFALHHITSYYIHLSIFANMHKLRLQFRPSHLRHIGPRNAWSLASESIVFQAFLVSARAVPKMWDIPRCHHGRKIPFIEPLFHGKISLGSEQLEGFPARLD